MGRKIDRSGLSRRALLQRGAAAGGAALLLPPLLGATQQAGAAGVRRRPLRLRGIDEPIELAPFDPDVPAGEKPDLDRRIAWANTSDAEFFLAITNSIEQAANDRDLEFTTAIANDDSAKNIEQMETFLQQGIAALCIQPLDANAQAPIMQRAIDEGIAVLSLVTPPSTSQAVADQFTVGNTQGLAAAKYITESLGGNAKVVYFNIDSIEVLKERHRGVIEGVMTAGDGVEIVSDIEASAITQEAGFDAMNTILQANPEVDVILGGDTLVLGALGALEASGRLRDDMYLSGIDGDAQALDKIRAGGPYRASFAFAYPLMGYAWGQFAADWLDGKSIPQVMQFNAIELNSAEAIDAFDAAMEAVTETWNTSDEYFTMLGNISYETRDQFLNYSA